MGFKGCNALTIIRNPVGQRLASKGGPANDSGPDQKGDAIADLDTVHLTSDV